jgi:hypothetical protein
VELAASAAVAKAFPGLTRIRISALSGAFNPPGTPDPVQQWMQKTASPPPADPASEGGRGSVRERGRRLMRGAAVVVNKVDELGAAYFITARLCGVLSTSTIFYGLNVGVDLSPYLEYFGAEEIGSVLGQWAGAVVLSSALYPFTMSMTVFTAPALAKLRKSVGK